VTLYAGMTGGNAAVLARGVTSAAGAGACYRNPPLHSALRCISRSPSRWM